MSKKTTLLAALCGLFLCIFFSWDFLGQNQVDGTKGLQYRLTSDRNGYIVTDIGYAKDTQIVIPSEYRNKPVVGIGEGAFKNCLKITSITIPDSIKNIEKYAFLGCENLSEINIPKGVITIENGIFRDCHNLTKMALHENVTSIEWNAFQDCTKLTSIELPKNLTEISSGAFWGSGLVSVAIPSKVTTIEMHVFSECRSLKSITIPISVTKIEIGAFSFCQELKEIHFEGTKEQWNAISKEEDWNEKTGGYRGYTVYCTDGNIKG